MLFVIIIYHLITFRKAGFAGVDLGKVLSLYNLVKHWDTSQFWILLEKESCRVEYIIILLLHYYKELLWNKLLNLQLWGTESTHTVG